MHGDELQSRCTARIIGNLEITTRHINVSNALAKEVCDFYYAGNELEFDRYLLRDVSETDITDHCCTCLRIMDFSLFICMIIDASSSNYLATCCVLTRIFMKNFDRSYVSKF